MVARGPSGARRMHMGFGQIGCGWAVDMGRGVRVLELLLA
eukprot:CAMPEP_0174360164 /NCGR_PEP_ID=MMETSP0811_2-20130205/52599_1 /TAXON_ID=73025 ORGANISM="Eutreptiella gymnastica-like, Strain CCMP1594" /NCGR_SAMPLE_ID=MMETSP0811_2 /ASSEMBLY_ACC=CAM_ASM_000667 /LENGTH=39 /DNA_ID= /DNA_START= /DNA_END= /DNA_ORIENTATION=